MDFTGLNHFNSYKLNRPLTEAEKGRQLARTEQASTSPQDWLSVISTDSTTLELVDRWYSIKGFATWMGLLIAAPFTILILAFFALAISKNNLGTWTASLFVVALFSMCVAGGAYLLRFDCFRLTHYPIRLNRRIRKVYAYRPDGSIITAGWDDLFVCVVENKLTMGQTSHDVRAHVLAEDGETVVDTFTLAYPYLGDESGAIRLWEYIRRYMETPSGAEKNYRETEICMPINDRKEGATFALIRTFALMAKWPALQLLVSPIWAITTWGRWLAMTTCEVPRWPSEIETACRADPEDPYRKDWRSNGSYSFLELGWPAICLAVGSVIALAGILWLGIVMWKTLR